MNESEPQINLTINSTEYELRRDNSELYTFLGQAAFAHIFLEEASEGNVRSGIFIPRELIGHNDFDQVAIAMVEHNYPAKINQLRVPEKDAEIITKILAGKDVEDFNEESPDWLPPIE
jgi:hypothetical protein